MIGNFRLEDGRVIEADVRPGQAICCSCGEVYDYRASQRGRHVCSPTELGEPAGPVLASTDVCPDCGLAKLPAYSRCYYCEQLQDAQVHNSAQLAAYDAQMERLHQPHRQKVTLREAVPIALMMGGAGIAVIPGTWPNIVGEGMASTGLLALICGRGVRR